MQNQDVTSNFLNQNLPLGISAYNFYVGLAVLAAVMCVIIVSKMMENRNRLSGRIKNIQQRRKELASGISSPKKRKTPENSVNFMRKVSSKFQLVKKLQLEKAELTMVQAGFRSKDALAIFAFFNLLTPLILFIIGIIIMETRPNIEGILKVTNYIYPIGGLYFGLKLPWFVLNRLRSRRYLQLQRALSDTLDLMTVCAEAGLSMPAALERVARELGTVYPEMAEELALTTIEINFYPDRNRALNNLAHRCDIKEIRGIVTVLIQTEKYGTPIAQALRVLSTEFRQARMLRAEGKAAKLPAIMTVPMILFILPTVFIVIITPAVITAKKNFGMVTK
jgi:tight adherence protein C